MTLANWLLVFIGAYVVVGFVAGVAGASCPGLFRPAGTPRRPVARPRPARMAVA